MNSSCADLSGIVGRTVFLADEDSSKATVLGAVTAPLLSIDDIVTGMPRIMLIILRDGEDRVEFVALKDVQFDVPKGMKGGA
ncbi:MAG: hypothetical protein HY369_01275 [Candidatus Aenigmarchaeota archaeon]|nr:hypothetical protein [Candidatus Aenigmarchaeota archaeon]